MGKVRCNLCGRYIWWVSAYVLHDKYYCEHCTDVKCIDALLVEVGCHG